MKYDFTAIEKKWQAKWMETKPFAAVTGGEKPKFYALIEFPYPSGQGLHVGHARPYTAMDVVARKKRMEGYNVPVPPWAMTHLVCPRRTMPLKTIFIRPR